MTERASLVQSALGRTFFAQYDRAVERIHRDVIELGEAIEQTFITLLAGGHVLLEGEPGVGKTLLMSAVARAIKAQQKRIQFTPETTPGDMYYSFGGLEEEEDGTGRKITDTRLVRGPIFTEILLSDEVNRASPRIHAPMLEPLEEGTVTLEGKSHELGFFFNMATQNPVESAESTYELPEALRERYFMMVHVPYPSEELLRKISVHDTRLNPAEGILDTTLIAQVQRAIFSEYVKARPHTDQVIRYAGRLVYALHEHPATVWGPGIRAAQDLVHGAAAHAFLHRRPHIGFSDIRAVAHPILRFKFERDLRVSRHPRLNLHTNDQLIDLAMRRTPLTGAS